MDIGIKHQSLGVMAYKILKDLILNNTLKSGEKIKQEKMAVQLGISRIPLRHALTMLENDGLVISYPQKGYYVKEVTEDELSDILDIRAVIESMSILKLAEILSKEIKERLLEFLNDFEKAFKEKDVQKYYDLDRKFHHYIVEATGNGILKKVSDMSSIQVLRYSKGFELDMETSFNHHKKIVDYLFDNKALEASKLLNFHFKRVKELFKRK